MMLIRINPIQDGGREWQKGPPTSFSPVTSSSITVENGLPGFHERDYTFIHLLRPRESGWGILKFVKNLSKVGGGS